MKRLAIVLLVVCAGCSAQSGAPAGAVSPDIQQKIERQIRAQFELPPDVKVTVGTPKPSEFPNYDQITLTLSGRGKEQKVDFLLSHDGKTLARLSKIDLTKDIYADRMNKIDVQGRPVRGNPNAKVTIVNFDDYECPFCSRMHTTLMQEILPQYGDRVKIIYKDYPLPMHPWAKHAANDANCLAKENGDGFWEFADYVHANQRAISGDQDLQKSTAELDRLTLDFGKKHGADVPRLEACLKTQPDGILKSSMGEAESVGVQATPTMFINGQRLEGAVDAEDLKQVLNQQLKEAGIQPPADVPPSSAKPLDAKPTSK